MTRKECLDAAAGCVLKDRQNQYGGPENNFERIAQMWNGYLGTNAIKPWDVAAMMGMLKMARARFNPKYADNWVDLAGYAACGIECATAQEEFDKALDETQKKSMEHMFKEPEGNYPENPDSSPEFKHGDRVQARLGDGVWRDAVVTGKEITFGKLHYTVKIHDFSGYYSLQAGDVRPAPKAEGCEYKKGDKVQFKEHLGVKEWTDARYERERLSGCGYIVYVEGFGRIAVEPENLRPAPKAERCEELVQKDAPQTPQELYQHIVDCNPSVYPRTPTGEELAEMAEEETHE